MAVRSVLGRVFRSFFREQKLRLQVEWLTHTDERIMELLEESPEQRPAELAEQLDRSEAYCADRCRQLSLQGLLEQIESAGERNIRYRLTEFGERYLAGEVDAEELSIDSE